MNEKTHILVVEDQGAHAELMRHAFASHADQFHLTVVGSLQQARTCLSQGNRPDLVITDLLLPDGKGIELLPRDEPPPFPLVLMTSHRDEKAAAEAIRAGALDYVLKSAAALSDMPRVAERALREWAHIVERMRAEKALKESREQYRMLFGRMLDGYALHEIIGVRRDGDETVFYVQDNDIDIEPPHYDKVFGSFEKLDAGTQGAGVGLAIVKRIVEVHGGRVWVESQGVGQGSTFCFTLADKSVITHEEA